MGKTRLDQLLVERKLAETRSQAQEYIRSGLVTVDGVVRSKPGWQADGQVKVALADFESYVSRAGGKLAAANQKFGIDFKGKVVLDVGSSTGGFTDYVLRCGAKRVVAVDVGTRQLYEKLRLDQRVELHEQTDIRQFHTQQTAEIAVVDVSFISLRKVLSSVTSNVKNGGYIIALCKPQFEGGSEAKHRGVVKNDRLRREIFKNFENWLGENSLHLVDKADSSVHGSKGNQERFYLIEV